MDQGRNRLAGEVSPYLLRHAANPVDWYPWGEEAFARARGEGRPIFLSIGFAACHWCRRMERESFEDEAVARILNDNYVSIKVDREERPDVDMVYQNAVQMLTGAGGWPLTLFLTPEGKPFFGGTYFPPAERDRTPGLGQLAGEMAAFFHTRRDEVEQAAAQVMAGIAGLLDISPPGRPDSELSPDLLLPAFRNIAGEFDGEHGGFGKAPKFPRPTVLDFLLRLHAATGEPHAMNMAATTLERMAHGGIHDQIGGGFHRYSTDERWLIPRFEKLLNDNAMLAAVYLEAFRQSGDADFRRVGAETLDYILRELAHPEGGFFSGQEAETRGVEGEYFIWTAKEARAVVGAKDADLLLSHFGLEPIGNYEGARSVLAVAASAPELTCRFEREVGVIREALLEGKRAMFEIRWERAAPAVVDTVIAGWNGLMISALARAVKVLGEGRYLEAANRCADFLLANLRREDGGLWRMWREGRTGAEGCLPDYALLIEGLLDLHEVSAEARRLDEGAALAEAMVRDFWDEAEGGFFLSGAGNGLLPARPKDTFDSPDPSGNAAAVFALLRLAERTGRDDWREQAVATLRLFVPSMIRSPVGTGHMLSALNYCPRK